MDVRDYLQMDMFEANVKPAPEEVEVFAERARKVIREPESVIQRRRGIESAF